MFEIIETNKKDIYAIGDIHGEFKSIKHWIKDHDLTNCILIFCGDFGLGFDGLQKEIEELTKVQKICEINDVDCYIIRGNHDNPEYFNKPTFQLNLSRFKPLSDYTVIKSPEHNILCVGGAVSTDRKHRISAYEESILNYSIKKHCSYDKAKSKVKRYWWENEPFELKLDILSEITKNNILIDTICSHSAPAQCFPITSDRVAYWTAQDETLAHDIQQERTSLSELLTYLKSQGHKVLNWYYGHYHGHNTETIDNTTFYLLDMGRNGRLSGKPGGFFDMKAIY